MSPATRESVHRAVEFVRLNHADHGDMVRGFVRSLCADALTAVMTATDHTRSRAVAQAQAALAANETLTELESAS